MMDFILLLKLNELYCLVMEAIMAMGLQAHKSKVPNTVFSAAPITQVELDF